MRSENLSEIIEQSFSAEPGYRLPANFAQKVRSTVIRREQWKTDLREYLFLMAVLIVLIVAASGIYYLLDKELVIRVVKFFQSNISPFVFMIIILNFILLADKVLLRLLFSHWKTDPFESGTK
jgi:hypothetical protein